MTDTPHPTPDLDREALIQEFRDIWDRDWWDKKFYEIGADMVLAHVAADRARRVEVTDAMVTDDVVRAFLRARYPSLGEHIRDVVPEPTRRGLQAALRAAFTAALSPAEPDAQP